MEMLFCVPGGGTSSVMYLGWKKLFKNHAEICALEIPGRGYKEDKAPSEDFKAIASELAEEIKAKAANSKYSIFGYCFGGLLTYEICIMLEESGFHAPENIYICGSTTPEPQDKKVHVPMLKRSDCREEMKTMFYRFFPAYLFSNTVVLKNVCEKYMEVLFEKYDSYGEIRPVKINDCKFNDMEADRKTFQYILKFANSFFENYKYDEKAAIGYYYMPKKKKKLKGAVTLICGKYDSVIGESWKEWQEWTENLPKAKIIDANHFTLTQKTEIIFEIICG